MEPALIILTCCLIGAAYRGKGGLFAEWGLIGGHWQHGIGAIIVGWVLSVLTDTAAAMPLFSAAWFAFTRPTPKWMFSSLEAAFAGAHTFRIWLLAFVRLCALLPVCALAWYFGNGMEWAVNGKLWALLWLVPLSFVHYLAGKIQKRTGADGVVAAECLMAAAGLMLWGLSTPNL